MELLRTLISAEKLRLLLETSLSGWYAYAALAAIVFAETGLLVGFFLPGDSLLFVAGMVAGTGRLEILPLIALLTVAAIVGDAVGYLLGRRAGPAIFNQPSSRWFKREHLLRTKEFYEKHGGQTIVIARFVPIIRTFAPFVAGVAEMSYSKFASYNIFGGIGWVVGVTLLGYFLGGLPFVQKYFDKVLIGIVLVSVLPIGIEYLRSRSPRKA